MTKPPTDLKSQHLKAMAKEVAQTFRDCTYMPGWRFKGRLDEDGSKILVTVSYRDKVPVTNEGLASTGRVMKNYEIKIDTPRDLFRLELMRRLWAIVGKEEQHRREHWLRYKGKPLVK